MMPEISLNVLDVTENSTRAGAKLVRLLIKADHASDRLTIRIADDGCGMTAEQISQVTDPFSPPEPPGRWGLAFLFSSMPQRVRAEAF